VDQHLYCWGEKEIANLLATTGFAVVLQRRVGYRLNRVLSRLPIPLPLAVMVSRTLGRLALVVGWVSGPMEFITVARRT
jgi:hypothetical protein